jgi:catechol 2,3-dioxygenase-like lactoylglutathione lyase family enzyme
MNVLFVAGFAPIVRDLSQSHRFYLESLGLPLDERAGDYVHTSRLAGVKHFGLWPLHEAAQSCFGTSEWPASMPVPQGTLELEVDDVPAAAAELASRGHQLVHGARTEPWGQTVARVMSPEGLLVGLTHTPWLRG